MRRGDDDMLQNLTRRIIAMWAAYTVLASSVLAAQPASGGARVTWTSVAVGLGAAGATVTTDRAYEGSGQFLGRVGWTRGVAAHHAAEIEVLGTREFGASDCVDFSPADCHLAFSVQQSLC